MSKHAWILVLAVAMGCAQAHVTDEVQPGLYELAIERELDACSPMRAAGVMGPVGVLVERGTIDAPVPDTDLSLLTAPRVRLAPSAGYHAETNRRVAGCEGAFVHEEWTVVESSAQSFTLTHLQRWEGLERCADVTTDLPGAPARDCASERRLRYDLAASCGAPCAIRLTPSGLACTCD